MKSLAACAKSLLFLACGTHAPTAVYFSSLLFLSLGSSSGLLPVLVKAFLVGDVDFGNRPTWVRILLAIHVGSSGTCEELLFACAVGMVLSGPCTECSATHVWVGN